MRGFRHRPLYVELKDRFRAARAFLSQPPPAGIAHPRRTITHRALTYEINVGVILVSRPMALEIVEEGRPVGLQAMLLEVTQRKRKAVVDADQRGLVFGQLVYQPFGDIASRLVFLRGWRRQNRPREPIWFHSVSCWEISVFSIDPCLDLGACRAAHTRRRSRALDDRYGRSTYHRCAACRLIARD